MSIKNKMWRRTRILAATDWPRQYLNVLNTKTNVRHEKENNASISMINFYSNFVAALLITIPQLGTVHSIYMICEKVKFSKIT